MATLDYPLEFYTGNQVGLIRGLVAVISLVWTTLRNLRI